MRSTKELDPDGDRWHRETISSSKEKRKTQKRLPILRTDSFLFLFFLFCWTSFLLDIFEPSSSSIEMWFLLEYLEEEERIDVGGWIPNLT